MIIFIILLVILFIVFVIDLSHKSFLKKCFNSGSVIVYGAKGTGKDLLFNYITNTRKNYYANIPYKKKGCNIIEIHQLTCNLSYDDLLNGVYTKSDPVFKENTDVFISDAGVFLPSQYDAVLHRKYKSFPVFYALSRHLYNMNIHANSQGLDRIWKALREQADTYIKTLGTIKLPFILITRFRYYDKYSSAQQDIRPLKRSLLKGEVGNVHNANVGEVKQGFIIQFKFKIKYDTRYFKKLLLNEPVLKTGVK